MAFNQRLKPAQKSITATAFGAVAAGTTAATGASNSVKMADIADGTQLIALATMVVNTTSLTVTPKWQGSLDGSTWVDIFSLNSAANVATAAGTGSNVTTTRALLLLKCAFRHVRCVFVTGGATAHATNDTYALSYNWLAPEF